MEKRTILAIALSLLILLSWSALTSKTQHVGNKEVAHEITAQTPLPQKQVEQPEQEKPEEITPASLLTLKLEKFDLVFNEPKAAIQEIIFKGHQNYKFPLKYGFYLADKTLNFKKVSSDLTQVTFLHTDQAKRITKKYSFSNSSYDIWLEVSIQNLSGAPITISAPLILGVQNFSPKNTQAHFQDAMAQTKEKTMHLNARKTLEIPGVKFLSLRDKYFCAIIEPSSAGYSGLVKKINAQESELGVDKPDLVINAAATSLEKFHIYLGPQDLHTINKIQASWSTVIYYGTFDIISQVLIQLLEFLNSMVHNWGLAIIILSLLVYFLLYPLSIKQMRSMKEMQVLQPKIEELRKTYKDNPQKLNKEIMALYKEHKVNPFGGCLPLLLQMPIFFALYQALMRSVALKGASFLWIKDLSEPDRLFLLPVSIPVLGNEFNILPIVMAIGMFIQQKLSSASATGAAAEQQKMMLFIMPIMFGLIFYHMPAGLVLYWFINSALMLVFQLRMSRSK